MPWQKTDSVNERLRFVAQAQEGLYSIPELHAEGRKSVKHQPGLKRQASSRLLRGGRVQGMMEDAGAGRGDGSDSERDRGRLREDRR